MITVRISKVAKLAHAKNITLKQAAVELNLVTPEEFDARVRIDNHASFATTAPSGLAGHLDDGRDRAIGNIVEPPPIVGESIHLVTGRLTSIAQRLSRGHARGGAAAPLWFHA